MPRALTIVLLLQLAQDPEDPSFWDFQGVCLWQAVGRLLPGPQLAYSRLHPSGLRDAFLQLPLVIARKAVPARLSLTICTSPSLSLNPCSVWAEKQAQELGDLGCSPSSDHGQVIALLWDSVTRVKCRETFISPLSLPITLGLPEVKRMKQSTC